MITSRAASHSLDTEQAVEGDELRAIKRYLAQRDDRLLRAGSADDAPGGQLPHREAGVRAGLGRFWPHMLRHSAGYALSNKGHDFRLLQDFMGHRDPTAYVTHGRPVDASRDFGSSAG